MTARIAALAGPGEILVSRPVIACIQGQLLSEVRPVMLRGLSEPVEVASINWQ